jgi:D-amino peptidase
MEAITGVVHWDQVDPNHPEYPRFRDLMTYDVNAAVRGAIAGGAESVTVTDGHEDGRNILIEELDPRAVLISGAPAPLSMVEGIDRGVDGVMFVGYHGRSGAPMAILDHTWSNRRVANLWINDRLLGEAGLNGAVCGHFNVPVIMISGDQTVCGEARELFGDLETAEVKRAIGRMAAECLPPAVTNERIELAAQLAVHRLGSGTAPAPFRLSPPIQMVVEFAQSEMADSATSMPGVRRLHDRKVAYGAEDMVTIYSAFQALVALAGS